VTVWVVVLFLLVALVFWAKGNPFRPSAIKTKKGSAAVVSVPRPTESPSQEEAPKQPRPPIRSPEERPEKPAGEGEVSKERAVVASVPAPPAPPPAVPMPPEKPPVARVALVIDDFGFDMKIARKFIKVPLPLSFSVLPHLAHTREVAALAAAQGHEVLVHMPMEPHSYPTSDPGRGALLLAMTPQEMVSRLDQALAENPYARGINNHMGSKFTENPHAMRIVLGHLKERGLYFLDSYTSSDSAAPTVARELGMPCLKRDIFLDHEPNEKFVRNQIEELIRRAKIEGYAVAIGHPHAVTLKVLLEEAPRFEKEGIEVVPLKKLLEEVPIENGVKAGA